MEGVLKFILFIWMMTDTENLGHKNYHKREETQRRITSINLIFDVRPVLEHQSKTNLDAEIKRRCDKILNDYYDKICDESLMKSNQSYITLSDLGIKWNMDEYRELIAEVKNLPLHEAKDEYFSDTEELVAVRTYMRNLMRKKGKTIWEVKTLLRSLQNSPNPPEAKAELVP